MIYLRYLQINLYLFMYIEINLIDTVLKQLNFLSAFVESFFFYCFSKITL